MTDEMLMEAALEEAKLALLAGELPVGAVVARGLVSYDSSELPAMIGRSTRDLAAEFGPQFDREVVHRDDLILKVRKAKAE